MQGNSILLVYQSKLCERGFSFNIATLKQYGDHFKIAQLKAIRNRGVEIPYTEKNSVNAEKLENNIVRARSMVREYGFCNPWDYFVTLTLRPDDHDRYDLKAFNKVLSQWLRDLRKRSGAELKFILVPEQHKNGAWHMHGLLYGIPEGQLVPFQPDQKLPAYIQNKLRIGQPIYNWPAYAAKFGFVTVEPLRDKDKAVSYITKYITKELARTVSTLGAHLYYASHGLQKATELKRGRLQAPIPIDYQNEHCAVSWFDADCIDADTLRGFFVPDK